MSKLRKEDLLEKRHTYTLGISTTVILLICIFILKMVPEIFISSQGSLHKLINPFKIKEQDKILNNFTKEKDLKYINQEIKINNSDLSGILAKSYVVYDVNQEKILTARNENLVLPLASLTKVITAISAVNLKNRNTLITIDSSKMRPEEYLDLGLKEGQIWQMGDLLRYGLTISSNSSMDIIAGTIKNNNAEFVSTMNDYVKSLGFTNFSFNSASGLDYGNVIGGKGTALEYAKLFAKAYQLIPDILSYTIHSKVNLELENENLYAIPNTNKEASQSVGLLASKTGFTDLAGGNLAVMVDFGLNRPIVIVVLGSTVDGRFQDVDKLYKATKKALYY